MGASGLIIVFILCLVSLGICLLVYFQGWACSLGDWAGPNCSAASPSPGPTPGPGPGPAPATDPRSSVWTSGQKLQEAPLEIGMSSGGNTSFAPQPTGYASQTTASYTMSFDISVAGPQATWRNVISHNNDTRAPNVFIYPSGDQMNGNKIQIYHGANGTQAINSTQPLPMDGTWTNIAWTVGSGTITLYVNGVANGTAPTNVNWPSPDPVWKWGESGQPPLAPSQTTSMKVANAYFWPSVLADTDLAKLKIPGTPSPAIATTSYYRPEPVGYGSDI